MRTTGGTDYTALPAASTLEIRFLEGCAGVGGSPRRGFSMRLQRIAMCGIAALLCAGAHGATFSPAPADGTVVAQTTDVGFDLGSIFVRWSPDVDPSVKTLALSLARAQVIATDDDASVWQLKADDAATAIATLQNLGPAVVQTVESADAFIRAELGLTGFQLTEIEEHTALADLLQVPVTIDGRVELMVLERRSIRAPGFKILVDKGAGELEEAPLPPVKTYVGSLDGVEGSIVSASLHDGVTAQIRIDGPFPKDFNVQPLSSIFAGAPESAHVVFTAAQVVEDGRLCGGALLHGQMGPQLKLADPQDSPDGTSRVRKNCQIAFDADFEFYQKNGSSVPNTTADIEGVMNGVRTTYERDCDVTFTITTVIVRSTSSDPYTSTNPETLLNQFRNHWQASQGAVVRDIAHLMTGKNVDGGTIGIAWLSAVCTSNGYGLSESRFTTNTNSRLALTAHEIGHNFSAGHCDGNGDCHIMCSGLGGCNGLGTPPFFGNAEKTTINNYAQSRPCLNTVGNTPPTVTIVAPASGASFDQGSSVTFVGGATDNEDDNNDLSQTITWTSNVQGLLGTGVAFSRSDLVVGNHTITASVTDSGGLNDTDVHTITINSTVTIPLAPSGQVSNESPAGSAIHTWVDNSDNETSFTVQRQQKVGTAWTGTTTFAPVAANTTSYANTPGQGVWRYRVRANNSAGSSVYTAWANAKPIAPTTPAASEAGGVVTFSWTDNSLFEENFDVQRQQRVGTTWTNSTIFLQGANATSYVESPGSGQWRYRVRSKVPGKFSTYTTWSTVTVP